MRAHKAGTLAPTRPVANVTATVSAGPDQPGPLPTRADGRVGFQPVHLGHYTVTPTFPANIADRYDLVGNPPAPLSQALVPGGVRLYAFLVDWHWIEFQVRDSANRPHANLGFGLSHQPPIGGAWTVLENGATPANGDIARDEVKRGRYKLSIPILSNAVWPGPAVVLSNTYQLNADASGFDLNEAGSIEILDAFDHSKIISTLPATIVAGAGVGTQQLRASWTPNLFNLPGLEQSQVVFRASARGVSTLSVQRTVTLDHMINVQRTGGAALNTQVTVYFSGGSNWNGNSVGGVARAPGPWKDKIVRIALPLLNTACHVTLEDNGVEKVITKP